MTRIVYVFSIVLTLILFEASPAQWVQTSGPEGGAAVVILADGADLYAGTYEAGIFKSTDGGASWQQKNGGFGDQTVVAMVKCGPYLIASGTEGLYRSFDGGDFWTLLPGFDVLGGVNTLAVQGTHVIAGTSYGGVYASTDTGATWVASNSGLPPAMFDALSVPSSTAAGSDYFIFATSFDSGSGVFRSTDLGATWTPAASGLSPGDIINALHSSGSTLFAAGTDVNKSTDMGASWTTASSGIPPYSAIWAFAPNGSNLFAVGLNGMFTTTNNGTSWTPVTGGLPVLEMKGLGLLGTDLIAGTIADGVYKSTDGGVNWSRANAGIRARAMTGFTVDGSVLYGSGAGVFRTTNDGDSWIGVKGDLNDSASAPALVYALGDTMFVTEGNIHNSLSRSLDGGSTWTRVWPEHSYIGIVKNIVRTASGYLTAAWNIYLSSDIGGSWNRVDSAGTSGGYLFSVERLNGALFAFGTRVFRSTDDGSAWADVTPTSPSFNQADMMAAVGATLFIGDKYAGAIYRSTDGGLAWVSVPAPATSLGTIDLLYGTGTALFACSEFSGIFLTTNSGTSWTDITVGLPLDQPVYTVTVHSGYLFAGTGGNSVWKRPMSQITSIGDPSDGLPARTTLVQNYPNPFNPSTTVRWTMATTDRIVLKVYDVLGREVATLFDGVSEPGEHNINWEAGGMPGGVYYLRMIAGSSVETRAMILMR